MIKNFGDFTFKEFCEYCGNEGIYMDYEKKCLRKCPFGDFCKKELNENGLPCARWRKYLNTNIIVKEGVNEKGQD